jgi:hypothetical protein
MSEKRKAMLAEAMKAELHQKLAATQQQLAEEQIVRERLSRDYANSVHQISVLDTALKRSLAEQAAKVCMVLELIVDLIAVSKQSHCWSLSSAYMPARRAPYSWSLSGSTRKA